MNKDEIRQQVINKVSKLIEDRFKSKINDLQLFARIFYASIISSYIRARTLGNNVGIIIPELEPITKALYAMSKKRSAKHGSFEISKAFEISSALNLSYRIPTTVQNNVLTYIIKFELNHPVLIALERGDVSWEKLEQSKIASILGAALGNLSIARNRRWRRSDASNTVEKELLSAIKQLNKGNFKIIKNKRPYMQIAVRNLTRQKDFINILIK